MKTATLKVQVPVTKRLARCLAKTLSVIAAAIGADLVTHLIHQEGAPGKG